MNFRIPDCEKCGSIFRNKNSNGYSKLKINIYFVFKRMSEMGMW